MLNTDLPTRLRLETAEAHLATERAFGLEAALASQGRMVDLLTTLYTFVAPLEDELRAVLPAEVIGGRSKAQFLLDDLGSLGNSISAAAMPSQGWAQNLCRTPARALGVMYVLEGSTLGGHVISKALRRSSIWPAEGLRYFDPYGSRTGAMWRQFCNILHGYSSPANDRDIVAAAQAAFAALQERLLATALVAQ